MIAELTMHAIITAVGIPAIQTVSAVVPGRIPAAALKLRRTVLELTLGTGHPSRVSGLPDIRGSQIGRFGFAATRGGHLNLTLQCTALA
jgi:hypothetical protein